MKTASKKPAPKSFIAGIERAMRRAAADARKTARMHGTPVYIWRDGKIVTEKP